MAHGEVVSECEVALNPLPPGLQHPPTTRVAPQGRKTGLHMIQSHFRLMPGVWRPRPGYIICCHD
jgi:hypothetical protein